MFDSIAGDYDALNHIMSLDADKGWRRKAMKQVLEGTSSAQDLRILDLACGTGDFSIAIAQRMREIASEEGKPVLGRIDGVDLSEGMLKVMEGKVEDKGLSEMYRVLKPGGHLSIVELTTPVSFPMRQLFHIYSHSVLPVYGRLISKDTSAYSYLTKTIEAFPQGERMTEILHEAGFSKASFKRLTFGICTMYMATK